MQENFPKEFFFIEYWCKPLLKLGILCKLLTSKYPYLGKHRLIRIELFSFQIWALVIINE